jgi:hypothetical protein
VSWVSREQKYFCKGGWTGFTDLPVGQSVRSPDAANGLRECAPEALRNPGTQFVPAPDFASLHPGYGFEITGLFRLLAILTPIFTP